MGCPPVSQSPLQWMPPAIPADRGGQATASCALCGIRLPSSLMVADGGKSCADVRWYCRDTWACTRRWTEARPGPAAAGGPGDQHAAPGVPADERATHEEPGDEQARHKEPGDQDAGPEGPDDEHARH